MDQYAATGTGYSSVNYPLARQRVRPEYRGGCADSETLRFVRQVYGNRGATAKLVLAVLFRSERTAPDPQPNQFGRATLAVHRGFKEGGFLPTARCIPAAPTATDGQ